MNYWMVRAGRGGKFYDEFIKYDLIATGWDKITSLANAKSKSELEKIYHDAYPNEPKGKLGTHVGELWAFVHDIEVGDIVLTSNPLNRTIYIGRIRGDYLYSKKQLGDMYYKHRRNVVWEKEVSRDVFSQDMRNSIGSLLTIFSINKHAEEIENVISGKVTGVAVKGRMRFPKKPKEDLAIGEPIDFEGLTNAPLEENGVIFLFGKLHERMGIRIKAIRKGFPDAAAEVWIKDRLYPRTIEFEFRTSDFKRHGHDSNKCDIIVCWEHDWRDCPSHIFVIELKSELENYIGA
jgi:hypothetical protein